MEIAIGSLAYYLLDKNNQIGEGNHSKNKILVAHGGIVVKPGRYSKNYDVEHVQAFITMNRCGEKLGTQFPIAFIPNSSGDPIPLFNNIYGDINKKEIYKDFTEILFDNTNWIGNNKNKAYNKIKNLWNNTIIEPDSDSDSDSEDDGPEYVNKVPLEAYNISEITYRPKNSTMTNYGVSFLNIHANTVDKNKFISGEIHIGGILDWSPYTMSMLSNYYTKVKGFLEEDLSQKQLKLKNDTYPGGKGLVVIYDWKLTGIGKKYVTYFPIKLKLKQWHNLIDQYSTPDKKFPVTEKGQEIVSRFLRNFIKPNSLIRYIRDEYRKRFRIYRRNKIYEEWVNSYVTLEDYFNDIYLSELKDYFKNYEKNNKIAMFTCRSFDTYLDKEPPRSSFSPFFDEESDYSKQLKLSRQYSENRNTTQANYMEAEILDCSKFDSRDYDCSKIGCRKCERRVNCCTIDEFEIESKARKEKRKKQKKRRKKKKKRKKRN